MSSDKKVNVYKADKSLQLKVGTGPLDEKIVAKCENIITQNTVDFSEIGLKFVDELEKQIKAFKTSKADMGEIKEKLTSPVMELKANATIFHYPLIGNLANVMLSFLEAIDDMDNDAVSIVDAHQKTLRAIIVNKMSGDGGNNGKIMIQELKDACNRYYRKQQEKAAKK